jgi:hypothetical protein
VNSNIPALALSAIVLACGAVNIASAQPAPRQPGQPPPQVLLPGRQPPLCDAILEIKSTDPAQAGHLKMGQWLRFLGPISPHGHMVVIPMDKTGAPPHAWRPGAHVAYRLPPTQGPVPWQFFLKVPVLSPPDHPGIEIHQYLMTVKTLEDRCPSNVDFETLPHEDEIIDDHPGHANAA